MGLFVPFMVDYWCLVHVSMHVSAFSCCMAGSRHGKMAGVLISCDISTIN
jgi:hypothetical protein